MERARKACTDTHLWVDKLHKGRGGGLHIEQAQLLVRTAGKQASLILHNDTYGRW